MKIPPFVNSRNPTGYLFKYLRENGFKKDIFKQNQWVKRYPAEIPDGYEDSERDIRNLLDDNWQFVTFRVTVRSGVRSHVQIAIAERPGGREKFVQTGPNTYARNEWVIRHEDEIHKPEDVMEKLNIAEQVFESLIKKYKRRGRTKLPDID